MIIIIIIFVRMSVLLNNDIQTLHVTCLRSSQAQTRPTSDWIVSKCPWRQRITCQTNCVTMDSEASPVRSLQETDRRVPRTVSHCSPAFGSRFLLLLLALSFYLSLYIYIFINAAVCVSAQGLYITMITCAAAFFGGLNPAACLDVCRWAQSCCVCPVSVQDVRKQRSLTAPPWSII